MALVVVAFAPAAAREKYTVSATLKDNNEVPKPKGARWRKRRVQRHVRREQDRRHADLEADVLASDRQGTRRAHPRGQARRRRPGDRPALRALQERPGRQGTYHEGRDLRARGRQGIRERPHAEERGRRDPRPGEGAELRRCRAGPTRRPARPLRAASAAAHRGHRFLGALRNLLGRDVFHVGRDRP